MFRCSRNRGWCAASIAGLPKSEINAEAAVQVEMASITQGFAAMDDAYLAARVQDVREVGSRLIRNLTQTPFQAFKNLPEGSIVVAEEITPADTALMDPDRLAGFCSALGGPRATPRSWPAPWACPPCWASRD